MAQDRTGAILKRLEERDTDALALLEEYSCPKHETLWREDARLYHAFGRRLISASHYARAFELAREGLAYHPADLELKYLRALALARGGSLTKAAEYAHELLAEAGLPRQIEVETRSLLARLVKDQSTRARDPLLQVRLAAESAALYRQAHQLSADPFPGINAATMSLLAGDEASARELVTVVVRQTQARLHQKEESYWHFATLGEACVILQRPDEAAAWYRRALAAAAGRPGDLAAMRRNLRLLERKVAIDDAVRELFPVGRVLAFTGHMIDAPARREAGLPERFPADPALEEAVRRAIDRELAELNAAVGYGSAACGSDILFAEAMLARGAELHLVLPYDRDDFYRTSVDFGAEEWSGWRDRCDRVLAAATEVHYATREPYLGDDVLLAFQSAIIQGLARARARQLDLEPHALGVLDPAAAALVGGTADFLQRWAAGGGEARVIDLTTLRAAVTGASAPSTGIEVRPAPASAAPGPRREVRAMLFADVKNFSRLREDQLPAFCLAFLPAVAEVLQGSAKPPLFQNTWGDGLFLVFESVEECADFAMRLLDRIGGMEWEKQGLPRDTTVRMGLHAGPVYPHEDPIIRRRGFFGSHVNRAARLEPVTPPGCAFTSEQFAALLCLAPGHPFTCEYVAVETLAKGYDRCPLYRLARGEDSLPG
jgi:class 3 adenylate cyclase